MNADDIRRSALYAWRQFAPDADRFPVEEIAERLQQVLPERLLEAWLERAVAEVDGGSESAETPEALVQSRSEDRRRESGMYMTPAPVAEGLAAAARPSAGDTALDLAAGTGRLLEATLKREPSASIVAVERDPALAVMAAIRLERCSEEGRVRVFCGDGLSSEAPWSRWVGEVDIVVSNPPYLREKGRRKRFAELRETHSHLEPYFGPRIDLAYLFVHRGLDFLKRGGRLALLSTAYWMTASGAEQLRSDLHERAEPVAFVRTPEERLFEAAPGHHSLVSVFERTSGEAESREPPRACTVTGEVEDWSRWMEALVEDRVDGDEVRPSRARVTRPAASAFSDGGWTPFASDELRAWAEQLRELGTPLGRLVEDHQGFVSGADRVTRRHLRRIEGEVDSLEPGDPGFLMEADDVPEALRPLVGTVVRPVLRGSSLEADTIRLTPPNEVRVLYIDTELDADQEWVVDHLRPIEPALADRREVKRGRMPWYRLHWPRDRGAQTRPKLVVPRRCERPRFMLDLSASAVSSDCTYLVAPDGTAHPVRYLATVMLLLNRPATGRYLRAFGKRKGETIEFYADPLQSLPLPVRCADGELEWVYGAIDSDEREAIEAKVDELLGPLGG